MYKNIEKQVTLKLKDLVNYQEGQVVSKTLVQNEQLSMTIFSFDKGEEISTHASGGDAMVTVLEGTGKFTVGGEVFILNEKLLLCRKMCPMRYMVKNNLKCSLLFLFSTITGGGGAGCYRFLSCRCHRNIKQK